MPGIAFGIEIRGVNRVRNGLRRLAADLPRVTHDEVGAWAKEARAILKSTRYPPPPPGSRYVRTGQLANRWKAESPSRGTWQIVNRANYKGRAYAVYVVGNFKGKGQAWMHRGRWWKAKDVIDRLLPDLRRRVERAIRARIKGL